MLRSMQLLNIITVMNYYRSVYGISSRIPTYECDDLISNGYKLKISIYKDNPDLIEYIEEKFSNGYEVKLVEIIDSNSKKSIIDIWVK